MEVGALPLLATGAQSQRGWVHKAGAWLAKKAVLSLASSERQEKCWRQTGSKVLGVPVPDAYLWSKVVFSCLCVAPQEEIRVQGIP